MVAVCNFHSDSISVRFILPVQSFLVVDSLASRKTRREQILAWRSQAAILPSMLLCDFGNLSREIDRLEGAGVPGLHLDVMDGHFVPNLTYGLTIVEACRKITNLPLDVHLMVANPADYLQRYVEAGADLLTVHAEALPEPRSALSTIRELGATAGLAINPATPLSAIESTLDAADVVLVMSVQPGFGGQAFEPVALEKLRRLRELVADRALLEVDGGVNETTIAGCAAAGAQLFVVGSAIFRHADYSAQVASLSRLCQL